MKSFTPTKSINQSYIYVWLVKKYKYRKKFLNKIIFKLFKKFNTMFRYLIHKHVPLKLSRTHLETAKISLRCEEETIWVSIFENCCIEFVHVAFCDCIIVGVNLDKVLWVGYIKVCATNLAWGWPWNVDDQSLRYWPQNCPTLSRQSSPSMLNWEASNNAIIPFISSENVYLSLPLLSQNLSNMSVRCSKKHGHVHVAYIMHHLFHNKSHICKRNYHKTNLG